ncbi:MAG TPA: CsbD family protein [Terriglobia bacterium]|nr:CsbD family protein [Terriglobia bacterium]
MKSSTKDLAQGKFHKVKGKAKEKIGRAAGKLRMENEGRNEKSAGEVQEKVGQVERVFEK